MQRCSISFLDFLESMRGNECSSEWLDANVDDIPFVKLRTPRLLTHSTVGSNAYTIFDDGRLGGREVLSGNVNMAFPETHFSVLPFLDNRDYCIVFDTASVSRRNGKPFYPTLCHRKSKEGSSILYFGDRGWSKATVEEVAGMKSPKCYIDEREWNMQSPVAFSFGDIEMMFFHEYTGVMNLKDASEHEMRDRTRRLNELVLHVRNRIGLDDYNRIRQNVYLYYHVSLCPFDFKASKAFPDDRVVMIIAGTSDAFRTINISLNEEERKESVWADDNMIRKYVKNGFKIDENGWEVIGKGWP